MTIPPLSYRVVGQDDYMLEIELDADGAYCVNCGDHTSHEPRSGRLSAARRADLAVRIAALGPARELPPPDGTEGFVAQLRVGDGDATRLYRFWEGALTDDPALLALVRGLESI